MDNKEWFGRLTEDAPVTAVARVIDVPYKTLDTQLRSESGLKPDMVVKIARAYGMSAVAALVDCGLIKMHEARDAAGLEPRNITEALTRATDRQILREIGRRLDARKKGDDTDLDPEIEEF